LHYIIKIDLHYIPWTFHPSSSSAVAQSSRYIRCNHIKVCRG
jgi:hypothetical protein